MIPRVTQIGERGHGICHGPRGHTLSNLLLEADMGRIAGKSRRFVFQFCDDALSHFGTDARRPGNHGLVLKCDGIGMIAGC